MNGCSCLFLFISGYSFCTSQADDEDVARYGVVRYLPCQNKRVVTNFG